MINEVLLRYFNSSRKNQALNLLEKKYKALILRISHLSPVTPSMQSQYPIALQVPLTQLVLLQIPKKYIKTQYHCFTLFFKIFPKRKYFRNFVMVSL